jgi:hypothetical protein
MQKLKRFGNLRGGLFFTAFLVFVGWSHHVIEVFLHRDYCEPKIMLDAEWVHHEEEKARWSRPRAAIRERCDYTERQQMGEFKKPLGSW